MIGPKVYAELQTLVWSCNWSRASGMSPDSGRLALNVSRHLKSYTLLFGLSEVFWKGPKYFREWSDRELRQIGQINDLQLPSFDPRWKFKVRRFLPWLPGSKLNICIYRTLTRVDSGVTSKMAKIRYSVIPYLQGFKPGFGKLLSGAS